MVVVVIIVGKKKLNLNLGTIGSIIIDTRLISIVSKPIKIVVAVIVVVVFVQKHYVQKMGVPKKSRSTNF